MINSKKDVERFLHTDAIALGRNPKSIPGPFDYVWKFEIIYRKYEYYRNSYNKGILNKIFCIYYKIRFSRLSVKLGFSIPINVFDEGLSIAHYGCIVVNGNARIGKNCRIQECVTIGATNGQEDAPLIGDNCFIGSGAKIIGRIRISDDVCIGAGSVVVKDIDEKGITVAGIPAKKISYNSSRLNLNPALFTTIKNEKGL